MQEKGCKIIAMSEKMSIFARNKNLRYQNYVIIYCR